MQSRLLVALPLMAFLMLVTAGAALAQSNDETVFTPPPADKTVNVRDTVRKGTV